MNRHNNLRIGLTILLIAAINIACIATFSREPAAEPENPETVAARTWAVMETQRFLSATPTYTHTPVTPEQTTTTLGSVTPTTSGTPIASLTPFPSLTPAGSLTKVPSLTPWPTATSGSAATKPPATSPPPCNVAQLIKHVTIPAGTAMPPNTAFTKVWRIKNIGSCSWGTTYGMVFINGDQMGSIQAVGLPRVVNPGEMVDVLVNLKAPGINGNYTGNWKLSNGTTTFGNGSKPFTVSVIVATITEGIVYNFAQAFCTAVWESGAGPLICPGKQGDAKGFVLLLDAPALEDRNENEPTLWTHPQMVANGYIAGTFPKMFIQAGDRFRSRIGCLFGYSLCDVTFELYYRLPSQTNTLIASWHESYNGTTTPVDYDLSFLAGQEVFLSLVVRTIGPATQAAAFWLMPQIYRPGLILPTPTSTFTPTPTVTNTPDTYPYP